MEPNSGESDTAVGGYTVLVNDEEQYSLWLTRKVVPPGWRSVGIYGSKSDCLEYVEQTWRDITPRSVRERRQGQSTGPSSSNE